MSTPKKLFQDAIDLMNGRNFRGAEKLFNEVLKSHPRHFGALNLLAIVLMSMDRYSEAEQFIRTAIEVDPRSDASLYNYAIIQKQLGRSKEALEQLTLALDINSGLSERWNLRGTLFNDLKDYENAIADFDRAIALDKYYAAPYLNKGYSLNESNRYDEALAAFDQALIVNPGLEAAPLGRGNVLRQLKRYDEALAAFDKALSLKADFAEAWLGRGNTFYDLKRHDDAIAAYDKALTLKPDLESAWLGRGNVFYDLKRYDDAIAAYDKALALKHDLIGAEGARLYAKMNLCDWNNYDAECANLISSVENKKEIVAPFILFGIKSSSDDQLQSAKSLVKAKCPPAKTAIWQGEHYKHDRIHVAYVSADFRQHPVSYLMAGMFECHYKSSFDVTAISIGPDDNSEMRHRLKGSFEQFVDAKTFSDEQIANLIRSSEVDILVDLMGFTADSRTGIFARRAAPLQINYLGYPGTMGAEYIDYIVADATIIPDESKRFYSEKIVALPNTYLATDRKRAISENAFGRSEIGLPSQGFVFCCFNNSYKLNPDIFDCWARILKAVNGSVFWLSVTNPAAVANLKREISARGVSPDRLVFAGRLLSMEEHLARIRLADLFLDTLPYNAHTTASDALWVGLPVLTCMGETFAGRVAASLLKAIGLPELITTTLQAYEQMAIDLATHPEKLAAIKSKLAENRLTTPLFDTEQFTKHIEAAYTAMYERQQAGLAPDHIVVPN